jgi:hypothetical protein
MLARMEARAAARAGETAGGETAVLMERDAPLHPDDLAETRRDLPAMNGKPISATDSDADTNASLGQRISEISLRLERLEAMLTHD